MDFIFGCCSSFQPVHQSLGTYPPGGNCPLSAAPPRDTHFPLGTVSLEGGSTTIPLDVGLVPVDSGNPRPHTPAHVHSPFLVLLPPVPCPVNFGLPLAVALICKLNLWHPGLPWVVCSSASTCWGNLLFQLVWRTGRCPGCWLGTIVETLDRPVLENGVWF